MGSAAQKCCNAPIAMLLCNIVCIKSGQLSYSVIRNFRQRHLLPTLSKRMVSSPPRRPSKTNETHRTSSRGGFCCFRPSKSFPHYKMQNAVSTRLKRHFLPKRLPALLCRLGAGLYLSSGDTLRQGQFFLGHGALSQGFGRRYEGRVLDRRISNARCLQAGRATGNNHERQDDECGCCSH